MAACHGKESACGSKRLAATRSTGAQEAMRQVRCKQEEQERKEEELRDKESVLERGSHPYGVQPMGNMYAGAAPSIRSGLGMLAPLADQAVLDVLEMLGVRELGMLTSCSRALYVFCHHDEVWRSLVLKVLGGKFEFMGNWKDTLARAVQKGQYRAHHPRQFPGLYSGKRLSARVLGHVYQVKVTMMRTS